MTTQEQLDQVNTAIAAITGGAQEYSIGNRRIRRGDLRELFAERSRLEAKLADETGSNVAVVYFDRR